jgi:RNA 3'-terminal phosphate cyclase (ATP)
VTIEVLQRGYYPRGGGRVRVTIKPSLVSGTDFERNDVDTVYGCSHASRLPLHVATRQRDSAIARLHDHGYDAEITTEHEPSASKGSGIALWCGLMGGSALGERGKRAEAVGLEAADSIIRELDCGASVDVYLADQLIPYMAMAESGSFTTRELSLHTKTNIRVCEQFTDARFEIEPLDQIIRVVC